MQIGKAKNGDSMKYFIKGILLVIEGLVAAIIVYPFIHELGHSVAALIFGAEIYEFEIFPIPNILCRFTSMALTDRIVVGFAGILLPTLLSSVPSPKNFMLWYFWFSLNCICIISFIVSLWALAFYKTSLEIVGDDMTRILQFNPEYRGIYFAVVALLIVIKIVQTVKSKPVKKCMIFFGV